MGQSKLVINNTKHINIIQIVQRFSITQSPTKKNCSKNKDVIKQKKRRNKNRKQKKRNKRNKKTASESKLIDIFFVLIHVFWLPEITTTK